MSRAILPGATIGVLGGGQLGRMLALAARRMGYRVHVFSPGQGTPAGQVADREISAAYDDTDAVEAFAQGVDVVTLEFENIPALALQAALKHVPVRPGPRALETAQNRLLEKTFLAEQGFPVAPFRRVGHIEDLAPALTELGAPCVLKSAGFGYDGKGQAKVGSLGEGKRAWVELGQEAVLEAFVAFEAEVSVVAARGVDGEFAAYEVIKNQHERHILNVSVTPAELSSVLAQRAVTLTHEILAALELVGVACVEFFVVPDGQLLVNEIAPRPHNSGHLTIEAHATSQFEQQLRAVCGLPLGSSELLRPAAMANLLGELWQKGEPDWQALLGQRDVKLHLYGKAEARPSRKMGHLTALADSPEEARRRVLKARALL